METIKIFYCYAHEDKELRDKLERHLSSLKRGGEINEWSDREILPGVDWEHEIEIQLNSANIILLLISSDFMHSNYCYNREMARALERQKAGEARVLPIILRPTFLESTFINELQQLPTGGDPLTKWANLDEGFKNVAEGISLVVKEMRRTDKVQVQGVVSEQAHRAEKIAKVEQVRRISNRKRRDELLRMKAREKHTQKKDTSSFDIKEDTLSSSSLPEQEEDPFLYMKDDALPPIPPSERHGEVSIDGFDTAEQFIQNISEMSPERKGTESIDDDSSYVDGTLPSITAYSLLYVPPRASLHIEDRSSKSNTLSHDTVEGGVIKVWIFIMISGFFVGLFLLFLSGPLVSLIIMFSSAVGMVVLGFMLSPRIRQKDKRNS